MNLDNRDLTCTLLNASFDVNPVDLFANACANHSPTLSRHIRHALAEHAAKCHEDDKDAVQDIIRALLEAE